MIVMIVDGSVSTTMERFGTEKFSSDSFNKMNNLSLLIATNGSDQNQCVDKFHIDCHCGSIATPPSTTLFTKITFPNGSILVNEYDEEISYGYKSLRVYYRCRDDRNILVGNNMRECIKGNWYGLVPRCAINNLNRTRLNHIEVSNYRMDVMTSDENNSENQSKNDFVSSLDKPVNMMIYYDQSLQLDTNGAFQVPLKSQPIDCIRWSLSPRQTWKMNLDRMTRVHYVRIKLFGNHIEDLYLNHEISIKLSLKNVSIGSNRTVKLENDSKDDGDDDVGKDSFGSNETNQKPIPIEIKCSVTIPKESQFSTYQQKYSANYLVLDFLCEIGGEEKSFIELLLSEDDDVDSLMVNSIEIRFEMLNTVYNEDDDSTLHSESITIDEFKQKIFVISLCELQIYSFRSDCGFPDFPVTAIVQQDFNFIDSGGHERKSFKFTCIDKNRIIKGNSDIECGHYGKWNKEFPRCDPSLPCNLLKNLTFAPGYLADITYETTLIDEINKKPLVPNGKFAKLFCIHLNQDRENDDEQQLSTATLSRDQNEIGTQFLDQNRFLIASKNNQSDSQKRLLDAGKVICRDGQWIGLDQIKCIQSIPDHIESNGKRRKGSLRGTESDEADDEFEDDSNRNRKFHRNRNHFDSDPNDSIDNRIQVVSLPVRVINILFALFIILLLIIISLLIYMIIFRKRLSKSINLESKNERTNETRMMMMMNGNHNTSDYPLFDLPSINLESQRNNEYNLIGDELYERITLSEFDYPSNDYQTILAQSNQNRFSDLSLYPQSNHQRLNAIKSIEGEERQNSIYGLEDDSSMIVESKLRKNYANNHQDDRFEIECRNPSSGTISSSRENFSTNNDYRSDGSPLRNETSFDYLRQNSIYEKS
ncbi:hypothetical protein QR98_0095510 [Sarcoptes scabiei]|uniref:Uncharacterized protein n=1 Tax=Sarcoptes scabiei TaxID=52283 RepID=A0A132AJ22_SARSC|nr:hypothetical protein QR98_0095510 [Sarcoptes scabiei]